ncbi:MAG: endonuclease/exonuclease/phosphatase family protein [Xanthomonadales bacterium]|nr:endonuclease/exonuclease/phosphatase family protein [Xanthomonadales bacterium]
MNAPNDRQNQQLRLLSFNIQSGVPGNSYRDYLRNSWRQVLPSAVRIENLHAIGGLVRDFDLVALQEADAGSLRSGYLNQTRYLADQARLPYWLHQANRKVGAMAHSGNGFLARYEPSSAEEHRLPGAIPGRGALILRYGSPEQGLTIAVVHLALGQLARRAQLKYLREQLAPARHLVVMGDFNCEASSRKLSLFQAALGLTAPTEGLASYPSWKPQRALDHILISGTLTAQDAGTVDVGFSDHLPVALTVTLPRGLRLARAGQKIKGPTAGQPLSDS